MPCLFELSRTLGGYNCKENKTKKVPSLVGVGRHSITALTTIPFFYPVSFSKILRWIPVWGRDWKKRRFHRKRICSSAAPKWGPESSFGTRRTVCRYADRYRLWSRRALPSPGIGTGGAQRQTRNISLCWLRRTFASEQSCLTVIHFLTAHYNNFSWYDFICQSYSTW